ncbi:MAG: hypothetical protein ACOYIK_07680 [Coriobacteriales bacterium]
MGKKSERSGTDRLIRIHIGSTRQRIDPDKGWRLANPFFLVAALWITILLLYGAAWSNLCTTLNPYLVIFLVLLICSFLLFGYMFRDQLVVQRTAKPNLHVIELTTLIICLVLIAGMVYNSNVPLLAVLERQTYNSKATNLPLIGTFFTAAAIWHISRLGYWYQIYKSRHILVQIVAIFSLFLITVQRQNIMICTFSVLFAFWTFRNKGKHFSKSSKIISSLLLFLFIAVALFVFGAIGNARYGRWSWNDSSMISAVGDINDSYPAWLPREYIWVYVYLVSPLANLNNNMQTVAPMGKVGLIFLQLLPSSIANRILPTSTAITPYLAQPSLTASTSYVNAYIMDGVTGMYLFAIIQQLLILVMMIAALHDRESAKFAGVFSVFYYAGLTFFDNPSSYLITSYLWIIVVLHSFLPQLVHIFKLVANRRPKTNC